MDVSMAKFANVNVDSVHYFQTTDFTHLHRMSNLIDYIRSVCRDHGKDTRLMTLPQDGNPLHISMIEYFTRFRDDILQCQCAKLTCFDELTVFHLLSYMGIKGYDNGIGMMSAEERMAASEKGYDNRIGAISAEESMAAYENGIGAMLAEERMAASEKGYDNGIGAMLAEERMAAYENGIGAMSAKERMAASEKGHENGIGAISAEERMVASEKGYKNGIGTMSAEERMAASEKGYENEIGTMSAKARMAARKKGNKMGGRRSTLSSNHTTGCRRKEPRYIFGKVIS
jgi:hypothetical protein